MVSEETWHFAAGVAGNLFALALFLSPVHTFVRIRRNKSTEQFSVNGTGAIFQLFYICIYIAHSQKEARVKMVALLLLVTGIFIAIAMVSYEFMRQPLRRMFIGCLSIASLISMFASPLSIIKLVIQTHSVEYMPFYLSLSTFLMSTSFFAYGILGHDLFVSAPNGIGSILGIIQLVLYLRYCSLSSRSCDTQPLLRSRV